VEPVKKNQEALSRKVAAKYLFSRGNASSAKVFFYRQKNKSLSEK